MSIRNKIFIFLISSYLLLFLSILISYYFNIQRQSASIKNEIKGKRDIIDATFPVFSEIIENVVIDYTFWDDMVYNILNQDKEWFQENVDQLPTSSGVNYVWIYNLNKELVNYTLDSSYRSIVFPLPLDQLDKILDVEENGKKRFCHYFIKDSSNIVEIFGTTVHKSDDIERKRRANGYFIVGKVRNQDIFEKLSLISGCKVKEVKDTTEADLNRKVDFFKTLHNYNGDTSVILQFTASEDYLNNEKKYGIYSLFTYVIIISFVCIFSFWFINSFVSKPLKQISLSLNKGEGSFISKLSLNKDEFGRISKLMLEFFIQKHKLVDEIEQRKIIQQKLNTSNLELTKKNEEFLLAKEKAEKSDRLKSSFLANMSHEIRTPLNGILGFSSLLVVPDLELTKRKQFVEIINKCGNQLMTIIDDLIDISKIEADLLKIEYKPVVLNDLLVDIYSLFKENAESLNINFVYTKSLSDQESTILTDGSRLSQVLINLIGNAFKFTHRGSIKFGYVLKNSILEFFVEDTGIGISKESQHIIFERFGQVEHGTTRHYNGSGLGLSISKALVNLMGGDIWLTSIQQKGTIFYFTIPYKPIKIDIEIKEPVSNNRNIELKNRKTILVAEDDEMNFIYIAEILSGINIELIHVKNGSEAIDLVLNDSTISLVLMDIKMPFLDGYQAIVEIKKHRKDLPIIVQTAYAQVTDKELAFKYGCDDYISKPINYKVFLKLLEKYLTD